MLNISWYQRVLKFNNFSTYYIFFVTNGKILLQYRPNEKIAQDHKATIKVLPLNQVSYII